MKDWFLSVPGSFFIYGVSTLYALQCMQYWMQGKISAGFLVLLYSLAGIPLIYMTK